MRVSLFSLPSFPSPMSNARSEWWMEHVKTFPVFEASVTDQNSEEVATYHVSAETFEEAERMVEDCILQFRLSLSRFHGTVDDDK